MTTKTLHISALQFDVVWENPQQNKKIIKKILPEAYSTDLLILPEMFSTGFSQNIEKCSETMSGETVNWLLKIADKYNYAIAGSLMISENNSNFNRFIFAFPNGQLEYYDKRHLFTFANEHLYYTKGTTRKIIEYKGWRILPQICYDLRFPVWSRNRQDYDIAIYIASWPQKRVYAWNQLLLARAIENQVFVVGVNRIGKDGKQIDYNGETKIIDPLGQILSQSTENTTQLINAVLDYEILTEWQKIFPAQKDSDGFEIINIS